MDYRNILKQKIHIMIKNDLTVGRKDLDIEPFTSAEIYFFLDFHKYNIELVITKMIDDYRQDNDLELLEDPLFDWIGEYLYFHIDTNLDSIHDLLT
jgi:hypothetical protein